MSEAACGKKAKCNPPVLRIVTDKCRQLIESVEKLMVLVPLKTSEIEMFIAADTRRLEREEKIAAMRAAADREFELSYADAYKSVELRLEAGE